MHLNACGKQICASEKLIYFQCILRKNEKAKNIVDMTHARKTYQIYHLTKCFEN